MNELSYAVGKLGTAVDELKGRGNIREKLFSAYMRGLARLSPNDFPDPLSSEYEQIMKALTWLPSRGGPTEGNIGATLRAMTDNEANALSDRIRALYASASDVLHEGNVTAAAAVEEHRREEQGDETEPLVEHPAIVGPPRPGFKAAELRKAIGKTISAVEYGVEERLPEDKHEGEAIVLHFTDGTALSIEVGSNAFNLASEHPGLKAGDVLTDLVPMWRQDRRPPE